MATGARKQRTEQDDLRTGFGEKPSATSDVLQPAERVLGREKFEEFVGSARNVLSARAACPYRVRCLANQQGDKLSSR